MCLACNPGHLFVVRALASRRQFLAGASALALGSGFAAKAFAQSPATLPPTEAMPALAQLTEGPANIVFHGGPIITVNDAMPRAEAIAVRQGRISAVGAKGDVMAQADATTKIVDLEGRTLLPGFIDAHMHTAMAFLDSFLDVSPFTTKSLDEAMSKMKAAAQKAKPGDWVQAQGLDPSLMPGQPPTVQSLDAIAPNNPVFVLESNGHVAYVNSKAFAAADITDKTPDPPQGRFIHDSSGKLTGRLEEPPAFMPFLTKMPPVTSETYGTLVRAMFDRAAATGCTALHDAGLGLLQGPFDFNAVSRVMEGDPPIRYSAGLVSTYMDKWIEMGLVPGSGNDRMRLVAIKAWADGSNQGGTGYLREPYLNSTSRGALNYTLAQMTAVMQRAHDLGWQLMVHANGDAAIDTTLQAYETVLTKTPRNDHRHRIEHCSILHPEQIDKMHDLGLSPSFLIGHVYYWGRAFRDNLLGPARADMIDPCASARKAGLRVSLHSDYNVTPIAPLRYIENAVTRTMFDGGEVLNPAECITPIEAIKAVTIDAAWQCQCDNIIGSLEVGKYADLVILEEDPTTVDPNTIKSIKVSETWLGGTRRQPAA